MVVVKSNRIGVNVSFYNSHSVDMYLNIYETFFILQSMYCMDFLFYPLHYNLKFIVGLDKVADFFLIYKISIILCILR